MKEEWLLWVLPALTAQKKSSGFHLPSVLRVSYDVGPQIFQKPRSHLKILGVSRVTRTKFHFTHPTNIMWRGARDLYTLCPMIRKTKGDHKFIPVIMVCWAGRSGDQIPAGGGGEILRTRPDRPWGPSSHLYKGYRVFSPGLSGRGVVMITSI